MPQQIIVVLMLICCIGIAAVWAILLRRRLLDVGAHAAMLQADAQQRSSWLKHQDDEIKWLRSELDIRPRLVRKTYKILTLGVKGTGKTSLTLKWANPLVDLGTIKETQVERYERWVSHVLDNDVLTEHVFQIDDWGGEHIVEAQHELIVEEIHGLLVVVDLGGPNANEVDPDRIQAQLREFQPQALRFLFGPKMLTVCKTVVLFINKSDLIPGTPAHVEEEAKRYYAPLIENLKKYSAQVNICILVGSASYGHSTHHLFSHFVEKILPKDAYDEHLLQRMKQNGGPRGGKGGEE
ncbi:MAG: GTPase domain-containing protein [Polyangiaceae bacterium]|nr:GTPase domain-containing protein [Polyangiaceae bacterium]NUQ73725.1 GTPase domain-containing protein [Polyangiaceae bacterium]